MFHETNRQPARRPTSPGRYPGRIQAQSPPTHFAVEPARQRPAAHDCDPGCRRHEAAGSAAEWRGAPPDRAFETESALKRAWLADDNGKEEQSFAAPYR